MNTLLFWSDNVILYETLTWALVCLLFAASVIPLYRQELFSQRHLTAYNGLFLFTLAVFNILARWPGFFHPQSMNPDEDQFLVAAWGLLEDPVFFSGAEAGSSGPMNIYPLLLPNIFGFEVTLFSGRLIAVLMLCICCVSVFYIVRLSVSPILSYLAAFVAALFFGWTHFWDFRYYTSEHPPLMYLCVALALFSYTAFSSGSYSWRRLACSCLSALFLSLVPLAKLQAIYPALFIGVSLLIVSWFRVFSSTRLRILVVFAILISASIVPIYMVILFWGSGVLDYAWNSYIGNSLAYKGGGSTLFEKAALFASMISKEGSLRANDLYCLTVGSIAALILMVVVFLRNCLALRFPGVRSIVVLLFFGMFLGFTLLSIVSPMRPFPHYLVFFPIPLILLLFACFPLSAGRNIGSEMTFSAPAVIVIFIFLFSPLAVYRVLNPHIARGLAAKTYEYNLVGQAIVDSSLGTNRVAVVWGYNPSIYTNTKLRSATRLCTSSSVFNDNHLREFFLSTYLDDIEKKKPDIFIDAVAPGQFILLNDRSKYGFENIPRIKEYVGENYTMVREVEGVRIFRRNVSYPHDSQYN